MSKLRSTDTIIVHFKNTGNEAETKVKIRRSGGGTEEGWSQNEDDDRREKG